MAEKMRYARNDLLVEPEWVEEHLHDSDVRLIDCRLEDAYRQVATSHKRSAFQSHPSPPTHTPCGSKILSIANT